MLPIFNYIVLHEDNLSNYSHQGCERPWGRGTQGQPSSMCVPSSGRRIFIIAVIIQPAREARRLLYQNGTPSEYELISR